MKTKTQENQLKAEENPTGLKLLHTLRGHSEIIYGIAFSPDGKKIASASFDNTIKLWQSDTGKNIATLEGHSSWVSSVCFSPDGKKIASASEDKTIKLWDSVSSKNIATLKGHSDSVWSVAFSPDGKKIVSASQDGIIKLWQSNSGKNVATLEGHSSWVSSVCFSPDGKKIASASMDNTIKLWHSDSGKNIETLEGHSNEVWSVCFNPDGKKIASGGFDKNINIWDVEGKKLLHRLEGHTHPISSCVFSTDSRLLASKSEGETRLWRTDTWQTVAIIAAPGSGHWPPKMAFHPSKPILATQDEADRVIKLWQLDYDILLGKDVVTNSVPYTTAKIVLVGDSGVGKTGLGWRLAHGAFKEQSSTHGQQFWIIDELGQKRSDGTECEAVLWDLAGQQDYRLVHALFLKDVDLALVLFDPGNREKPLNGVLYWLKQLSHKQKASLKTMLIGARMDRGQPTLTAAELAEFCEFHHVVGGYHGTSAKGDNGIAALLEKIKAMIPWDEMPATITTITFKRIKEFVLNLKEQTSREAVLVRPDELRHQLEKTDKDWAFSNDEMMTAVKHLENHGYITICFGSDGQQSILLFPDILVNLVSSFVLEARGNVQGLGVLDEKRLLDGDYEFTDLKNIKKEEQEILLESAAVLFLNQNICFRESIDGAAQRSLLVFPSLINEKRPKTSDVVIEDDASYLVTGSIENVYASMVVLLGYTDHFTRQHQWQNQAQYELQENQICGFRQISEHEGEIELSLYYNDTTPSNGRMLFQGLFETFLQHRDVTITRFEIVVCPDCKERQEHASVTRQIAKGRVFVCCANCGDKIDIPETTQLTAVAETDREIISSERDVVGRRTSFEASLVRIKAILREREEADSEPSCFISYA